MATYNTDLQLFDAADTAGNWAELAGHLSGGAPSADTENYFQNSISVSQSTGQATNTAAGMQCDYGANITWTDGWVIIAWLYYAAPTNLDTWVNGGFRIGVGSTSGNMYYWNASGSNFGDLPKAAWQNVAIDPNDPTGATNAHLAADATDGTPTTTKRLFGSLPNVLAKITKGNPHACDVIRFGRGEIYATGTGGLFSEYATANDGNTAKWGLFELIRGGYLWKGLFSFGQTGTSLAFTDSNKTIFVDDCPRVKSDFNKMQTLNASTTVVWNNINIVGTAISVTGSAPVSPGVFNFSIGSIDINGGRFSNLGTWIFSGDTIDDATFEKCKLITSGNSTFTNVLFSEANATSAITVANLNELDKCIFRKGTTGHAVELTGAAATYNWDNLTTGYVTGTSGNGVQITGGSITGNETIHITATTGTFIINVSDGATTPSVSSAGAIVNVVAGQRTFNFTVNPSITNYEWRIYSITALGSLAGSSPLVGQETATADNQSYSYSYTVDIPIAVQIISQPNHDYIEAVEFFTLIDGDQDITINLEIDNNN